MIFSVIAFSWGKKVKQFYPHETFKVSEIITSSSFALLSLILGFTYSMAVGRFELRRKLVVDEANAISTAYLRGTLLKTDQLQLKKTFLRYIDLRMASYDFYSDRQKLEEIKEQTGQVQAHILKIYKEIIRHERSAIEGSFIYALTVMYDTEFERTIALEKFLPYTIYIIILLIALVTIGMLNFDRGYSGRESHWPMSFFIILFSIVVCFIHDLDHPHTGAVTIGQDALIELRQSWLFK